MQENRNSQDAPIVGTVFGCYQLNVRERPDLESRSIGILSSGDHITIRPFRPDSKFFRVRTESGIEGFCLKSYIRPEE